MELPRKIQILIDMVDHIRPFRDKHNAVLINYLAKISTQKEVGFTDTMLSTIAKKTKLPEKEVQQLVKDLYKKFISRFGGFNQREIKIKHHDVEFFIYPPASELEGRSEREQAKLRRRWTHFICSLPVIPKIGETINLQFIDPNVTFDYGVVEQIIHRLNGKHQRIQIFVNPLKINRLSVEGYLDSNHYHREKIIKELIVREQPFTEITKNGEDKNEIRLIPTDN